MLTGVKRLRLDILSKGIGKLHASLIHFDFIENIGIYIFATRYNCTQTISTYLSLKKLFYTSLSFLFPAQNVSSYTSNNSTKRSTTSDVRIFCTPLLYMYWEVDRYEKRPKQGTKKDESNITTDENLLSVFMWNKFSNKSIGCGG